MKKYFTSFNKLLLSYIIIIIIPITVMLIYYYPQLNFVLKQQVLEDSHHTLSNVQYTIDRSLEDVLHTYVSINSNAELSTYFLENSPTNRMKGIEALQHYLQTNKFIDNILIYLKNKDMLIEKRGVNKFEENYFTFENWTYTEIKYDVTNTKTITFKPVESYYFGTGQAEKVIPIIFPVNYLSNTSSVFLINKESILDIFQLSSSNEFYQYYVIDENGQVVVTNDLNSNDVIHDINYTIKTDSDSIDKVISIADVPYVYSTRKSTVSSLTYVSLLPYSKVIDGVEKIQFESLVIIFTLIILGSLISFLLSKINFRPVAAISELFGEEPGNHLKDYQLIQYNIQKLIHQNNQMTIRVNQSIPANQELLLKQVINNQIQTLSEFNNLGSNYDIALEGKYFSIVIIKARDYTFSQQQIETINQMSYEGISGYLNYGHQKNALILITGFNHPIHLSKYLNHIESYIVKSTDHVSIAISEAFGDFSKMNLAYNQCLKVLDYVILKSINGPFNYDELPQLNHHNTLYPAKLMIGFKNALLINDMEMLDKNYKKLITILNSDATTPSIIKHLAYDLYALMFDQLNNWQKTNLSNDNFRTKVLFNDYSINHIEENLNEIYTIISMVQDEKETEKDLITSILLYINNNYKDYNISLSQVAEAFNMTSSNLSHYFKKHTKVNFLSYIKYLRIDEAKKLLNTTDLTVTEIGKQVGFYATTSFNRTFKKEIGMTPLQYKASEKEENK